MTDFSLIQYTQWVLENCIHDSYRGELKLLKWSPIPTNKDIQSCTLPTEGLRRHAGLGKCSITVSSTHFGRRLRQIMTMPTSTMASHLQDYFREPLRSQYLIHKGLLWGYSQCSLLFDMPLPQQDLTSFARPRPSCHTKQNWGAEEHKRHQDEHVCSITINIDSTLFTELKCRSSPHLSI